MTRKSLFAVCTALFLMQPELTTLLAWDCSPEKFENRVYSSEFIVHGKIIKVQKLEPKNPGESNIAYTIRPEKSWKQNFSNDFLVSEYIDYHNETDGLDRFRPLANGYEGIFFAKKNKDKKEIDVGGTCSASGLAATPSRIKRVELLLKAKSVDAKTYAKFMFQARTLMEAKNFRATVDLLESVRGQDAFYNITLGMAYKRVGRLKDAIDITGEHTENPTIRLNHACYLSLDGQTQASIEKLRLGLLQSRDVESLESFMKKIHTDADLADVRKHKSYFELDAVYGRHREHLSKAKTKPIK